MKRAKQNLLCSSIIKSELHELPLKVNKSKRMKRFFALSVIVLFAFGCNAQKTEQQKEKTENKPNESWTVNKEVDENGNVIRYDSTYTWSYSNVEGDSVNVNVDSLMNSFKNYFGAQMPSVFGQDFMNPMMNDSMLHRDFFAEDFFQNQFKYEFFDADKMFQRMDSIRGQFFKERLPELEQKIPPKK